MHLIPNRVTKTIILTGMVVLVTGIAASAQTDTYITSVTNPQTTHTLGAKADLSLLAGKLHVVITDTTAPGTTGRADLLSTFFFTLQSGTTISTANGASNVTTSLTAGSTVVL